MPKPNDALVLGELCWHVQSMIYKNVLPPSEYDERVSYKIDYMEENLGLLEDEAQTSEAKQAWKQVLEILNWKEHNVKRLARAVRIIRQQTNVASLLELNEATINQPVQRMNDEGKLERWSSLADVMELIRVCRRN